MGTHTGSLYTAVGWATFTIHQAFFFYVQGLPQVIINLPNQEQPCVCGIMSW